MSHITKGFKLFFKKLVYSEKRCDRSKVQFYTIIFAIMNNNSFAFSTCTALDFVFCMIHSRYDWIIILQCGLHGLAVLKLVCRNEHHNL